MKTKISNFFFLIVFGLFLTLTACHKTHQVKPEPTIPTNNITRSTSRSPAAPPPTLKTNPRESCESVAAFYNQGNDATEFKERVDLFKKALDQDCQEEKILAMIYNNLGDAYEQAGRYKEAIAEYKEAIFIKPDHLTPYIGLGNVYSKIGVHQEADSYYQQYLKRTLIKDKEQLHSSLSLRSKTRAVKPVPSETLYFGFDRADLTEGAQKQLEELLALLLDDEFSYYRFQLIGHTCSLGERPYNQWLSENRGESVKQWLKEHGYPAGYLEIIGFGEDKPIAENITEEGRKLNRRVEIKTVGLELKTKRSYRGEKEKDLLDKGHQSFSRGNYQEAASFYERALEIFKQDNFAEGIKTAHANFYLVYLELGDGEKAQEHYYEFLTMAE